MQHLATYYCALLFMCLVGCASSAPGRPVVSRIAYPAWVTQGSGAYTVNQNYCFYGLGQISGIKNTSLAQTTADNRARAELLHVFNQYTAILLKDYEVGDSFAEKPLKQLSKEEQIEQLSKFFLPAVLPHIDVIEHFLPSDGSVYALAKFDLMAFVDNLDHIQEISDNLRQFIRQHAVSVYMKQVTAPKS